MGLTARSQAYIRGERFNQPIFGCNNLSGAVFSVRGDETLPRRCFARLTARPAQVAGGGPAGGQPPHSFTIYFREARVR